MKKFNKTNSGVTLVEALVAISIFVTSILAMVSVLASGVSNTNYSKSKIIASYLAEEGIEYIKNMRDTFMLYDATDSQTGWNSFITKLNGGSCLTVNGCYFDGQNVNYLSHSQPMTQITLTSCGASCPAILYDATTGEYGYSSGTDYGFVRKVFVSQVSANEYKVSSTVSWKQGSGNYNMTFSESIFNWIE